MSKSKPTLADISCNELIALAWDLNTHNIHVTLRPKHKRVGEIYQEVDGMYVFAPISTQGCWAGWILKALGEILEQLNKNQGE